MPTAVERLLDSFLKLDGLDDRGALNQANLKIDDAFLKLSTASADDFLKIENLGFIKFAFEKLGDSFLQLGDDFHKVTVATDAFGDAVLKLAPPPPIGTDSVDRGGGLQADFIGLDHKLSDVSQDLKILGSDFLKLDTAPNFADFQQKWNALSGDFHALGGDTVEAVDAFHKLSLDFLKLGQGGDRPSPLDLAYKELGGELQSLSDGFRLLVADFANIGDAFAHGSGGGGGAGRPGDPNAAGGGGGAGGPIGGALALLYQHFHDISVDLGAFGDGSVRVLEALQPSSPTLVADTSGHGNGHG
jgi:hypothetical protein